MAISTNGDQECSVNYEASYVYDMFFKGKAQPKTSRCSRPALVEGKCILHSKITDKFIEFDEALGDEVKALGIPFLYDVDFSRHNAGFLDSIVSAVAKASGTRMVKFEKCVFPGGLFSGGSYESAGFYDCNFGDVQFMLGEEAPASYEFFRCHFADLEAREATVASLNLHGSEVNNVAISRVIADSVSMRGARVEGRLEIYSSTIRSLDLAYMSVEDWTRVRVSGVTHSKGVSVSAVGSALSDSTFFGVDWKQRDKGGLILADEEDIRNPALDAGEEQLKPEACQVLTMASVAQTYRNFIDVFERTRQYDLAEECFVASMDVQSVDPHLSRTHRFAIRIYNAASRYGSSYLRAALVVILLLGVFMGLYSLPPINVRLADTKQAWLYTGLTACVRRLGGAALHSLEVATFLKNPLYETYTPGGKIVEAAEIILVPAQVALLLFAVRRRFKR
jgi:hypothetical protein